MKRSEMVYKLAVWFLENQGGYKADEFAHKFLMRCEELGMLPPKHQSANSDNPIFLELENYTKLLYNWEPEDE